jgi:hypothetical protein
MANVILEAVVLRGNPFAGVVTGTARIGSNVAADQTPDRLSHLRRLSQCLPRTDYPPVPRRVFVEDLDADRAAKRAGRPGSHDVLVRRSPAMTAGPAVLWGWPGAVRVPGSAADRQPGFAKASLPASVALVLRERPHVFQRWAERTGSLQGLSRGRRLKQRLEGMPAWSMPAMGGTFLASTRGEGDR